MTWICLFCGTGPAEASRNHIDPQDIDAGTVQLQVTGVRNQAISQKVTSGPVFDWSQQSPVDAFDLLITALAKFALNIDASLLQVVTGSSMARAKKYDENSMLQEFESIVAECKENPRAILCVHLESLVRVQTDEGGGGQAGDRPRVLNTKLLFSVLDTVQQHATNTRENRFWLCVVSTHPYLSKQVHDLLQWPSSEQEKLVDKRNREQVKCVKCGLQFQVVGDERPTPCKYLLHSIPTLNTLTYICHS